MIKLTISKTRNRRYYVELHNETETKTMNVFFGGYGAHKYALSKADQYKNFFEACNIPVKFEDRSDIAK